MNKLEVFSGLGYPLLLATSRKRFIGRVLDLPLKNVLRERERQYALASRKAATL